MEPTQGLWSQGLLPLCDTRNAQQTLPLKFGAQRAHRLFSVVRGRTKRSCSSQSPAVAVLKVLRVTTFVERNGLVSHKFAGRQHIPLPESKLHEALKVQKLVRIPVKVHFAVRHPRVAPAVCLASVPESCPVVPESAKDTDTEIRRGTGRETENFKVSR